MVVRIQRPVSNRLDVVPERAVDLPPLVDLDELPAVERHDAETAHARDVQELRRDCLQVVPLADFEGVADDPLMLVSDGRPPPRGRGLR